MANKEEQKGKIASFGSFLPINESSSSSEYEDTESDSQEDDNGKY